MFLYLLKAGEHYKIGITSGESYASVDSRVSQLQTGCPFPIRIAHAWRIDDAAKRERIYHQKFDDKRTSGEWFALSEEDVEYIRQNEEDRLRPDIEQGNTIAYVGIDAGGGEKIWAVRSNGEVYVPLDMFPDSMGRLLALPVSILTCEGLLVPESEYFEILNGYKADWYKKNLKKEKAFVIARMQRIADSVREHAPKAG